MKVLLRADASPLQGTGHVMRCLTLAEELKSRGHEVLFLTNESRLDWLEKVIAQSSLPVLRTTQHSMNFNEVSELGPDWVVTDSYEIDAGDISAIHSQRHVMAIVDGNDRGIEASLYLDHNLGAELGSWSETTRNRLLLGNKFALIRDAILQQRRVQPGLIQGVVPHIVAVMGGSDPTGIIVQVASALAKINRDFTASIVVDRNWRDHVENTLEGKSGFQILAPTAELPAILGRADIAVSASGTSAWELCTLGIPSLLIAVVENQCESLARLVEKKLAFGLDLAQGGSETAEANIVKSVTCLLNSRHEREKLSYGCLQSYDGRGKERVVAAMEAIGAP